MSYNKQRIYMKSEEFKALDENILVKPEELKKEETSESGFVISINKNNGAMDRPTSGVVVTVGDKVEFINEGEFVLWPTTDGIDFEFDDGHFLLLRERSIIGKRKG